VGKYKESYKFPKLSSILALYFMMTGLMILILQIYFTVSFSLSIHVLNIAGADGSRIILYI